jgi:hypothetical protein
MPHWDIYHTVWAYILMGLAGCSVALAVLVLAAHFFGERKPKVPPRPDIDR